MSNKFKHIICSNCGLAGHIFKKCRKPKISLGLIAFKRTKSDGLKFLMIRRKDTHGFVEFMRGKYELTDIDFLKRLVDEMTLDEKRLLLEKEYIDLWKKLWLKDSINSISGNNRQLIEFKETEKKFNQLKQGYKYKNSQIKLEALIKNSKTAWNEPEWGFPKGRRNIKEIDFDCALREFEEESGLKQTDFITYTKKRFYENFTGSNNIKYCSIYYIGKIITDCIPTIDNKNYHQYTEIGDIAFYTYSECFKKIRPYSEAKKTVLRCVHREIISWTDDN